jgi:hypothetical protein
LRGPQRPCAIVVHHNRGSPTHALHANTRIAMGGYSLPLTLLVTRITNRADEETWTSSPPDTWGQHGSTTDRSNETLWLNASFWVLVNSGAPTHNISAPVQSGCTCVLALVSSLPHSNSTQDSTLDAAMQHTRAAVKPKQHDKSNPPRVSLGVTLMLHILDPEHTHLKHTCPCPHHAARWHEQDHHSSPCSSTAPGTTSTLHVATTITVSPPSPYTATSVQLRQAVAVHGRNT